MVASIRLSGHSVDYEWLAPYGLFVHTYDLIWHPQFSIFLNYLLFVCIAWGLLNLLPVYPLDGGQIAREILLRFNAQDGVRQSLILSIITAAGLAVLALSREAWYLGLFFGYLGYTSYTILQAYTGGRR